MTFPLKEEVVYLEQMAIQQHRIYKDAADFGLYFDEFDEYEARHKIKRLMSFYPYTTSKWDGGKEVNISIFIEKNHYYNVGVTHHNIRPRRFLTLSFTHSSQEIN